MTAPMRWSMWVMLFLCCLIIYWILMLTFACLLPTLGFLLHWISHYKCILGFFFFFLYSSRLEWCFNFHLLIWKSFIQLTRMDNPSFELLKEPTNTERLHLHKFTYKFGISWHTEWKVCVHMHTSKMYAAWKLKKYWDMNLYITTRFFFLCFEFARGKIWL